MARPPSVILTDQQRWDTTGVHGNPADVTPEFDGIARAGTHFSLAFTPQPVCAPARATLQTRCWPSKTGVFRNGIALPAGVPTLASVFEEAGYVTGYIGKWHLGGADAAEAGRVPPGRRGGYRRWLASDLLEFTSDKRSAHDASVRVPLAVIGPGFTGGGRVHRPVSTVDLAPTLIEAAGLSVPASMQGRSLLPLVGGGSEADRPGEVFFCPWHRDAREGGASRRRAPADGPSAASRRTSGAPRSPCRCPVRDVPPATELLQGLQNGYS